MSIVIDSGVSAEDASRLQRLKNAIGSDKLRRDEVRRLFWKNKDSMNDEDILRMVFDNTRRRNAKYQEQGLNTALSKLNGTYAPKVKPMPIEDSFNSEIYDKNTPKNVAALEKKLAFALNMAEHDPEHSESWFKEAERIRGELGFRSVKGSYHPSSFNAQGSLPKGVTIPEGDYSQQAADELEAYYSVMGEKPQRSEYTPKIDKQDNSWRKNFIEKPKSYKFKATSPADMTGIRNYSFWDEPMQYRNGHGYGHLGLDKFTLNGEDYYAPTRIYNHWMPDGNAQEILGPDANGKFYDTAGKSLGERMTHTEPTNNYLTMGSVKRLKSDIVGNKKPSLYSSFLDKIGAPVRMIVPATIMAGMSAIPEKAHAAAVGGGALMANIGGQVAEGAAIDDAMYRLPNNADEWMYNRIQQEDDERPYNELYINGYDINNMSD